MFPIRIPGLPKSEGRIKSEIAAVEQRCASIASRFERLGRLPTAAERDARRLDFLASRRRLGELETELLQLKCPLAAR